MYVCAVQAFIVAGGFDDSSVFSSVLTLVPGATAWTQLASLPRPLYRARASIVAGKVRVTGGFDQNSRISEVMIAHIVNHYYYLKMEH